MRRNLVSNSNDFFKSGHFEKRDLNVVQTMLQVIVIDSMALLA